MHRFLRIRSALLTLLAVYVVLTLISNALQQYLGLIIFGIVAITVVYLISNRSRRL
jgi:hypothetical protein